MSNPTRPECWAYFDCFAGLSGDMTLGAMLDGGLDQAALEEVLAPPRLPGFRLGSRRVTKEHLTGVKVDFVLDQERRPGITPPLCPSSRPRGCTQG